MGGSGGEHMLEGAVASRRSAGRDCPGLRARAAGRPWAGCAHAGCCVWWRLAGCCSVAVWLRCAAAGWLAVAVVAAAGCRWLWGVRWLWAVCGVCRVWAGCGTAARTWIYSNIRIQVSHPILVFIFTK